MVRGGEYIPVLSLLTSAATTLSVQRFNHVLALYHHRRSDALCGGGGDEPAQPGALRAVAGGGAGRAGGALSALDAQFVGFAQILVYVGAVAILIVFAMLLTRSDARPNQAILAPGVGDWRGDFRRRLRHARLGGVEQHGPARRIAAVAGCDSSRTSATQLMGQVRPAARSHRPAADRGVDRRRDHCDEGRAAKRTEIGDRKSETRSTTPRREVSRDPAARLSARLCSAVRHRPGGRADAAQRHPRAGRHRTDAQRGQPELHRVLALRPEPGGA